MKTLLLLTLSTIGIFSVSKSQNLELVADINKATADPTTTTAPEHFVEFGGELYFSGVQNGLGRELLRYNGSNIQLVADLNPTGSSNPSNFTVLDGKLYFTIHFSNSDNMRLMEFDGVNTPVEVYNINATNRESYPRPHVYNGNLYFAAFNNGFWDLVSYNSNSGAAIVSSTSGVDYFSAIRGITTLNGLLWYYADGLGFLSYNGNGSPALMSNSGNFTNVLSIVPFNGFIYFVGMESTYGAELWRFDGFSSPTLVQ